MAVQELLDTLGYTDSPTFLRKGTKAFASAPSVSHIFRSATKAECGLIGVYTLNDVENPAASTCPVVYVCQAKTEQAADQIHRLVWNQDIVPFLIVYTPKGIKFYSGFEYSKSGNGQLHPLIAFNEASQIAKQFHSDEIDSGRLWKAWSSRLKPERRVNWRLLDNLRKLDSILHRDFQLPVETSHALIGKYVYLSYLRHRGILSDRKLEAWGLKPSDIFGKSASIGKLAQLVGNLEDWLNGNIFPLAFTGKHAPKSEHVKLVAGVFHGDDVFMSGERQLSLDFQAYDFSYIPIETLSVVYEQFLHTPDAEGKSKGKEEGAYYTPIPVVNYMLGEMEQAKPLVDGIKVLDPACGSGAFLVQCYRRLIEKTYPQNRHKKIHPIPLRELLVNNIFGIDRDADACAVTELSLLLTLLDYVDPPDLEDDKRIKLPTLRDSNIFNVDFFDAFPAQVQKQNVNWIVGNPPWKKLNPSKLNANDRPAWQWMQDNDKDRPVGGNELARAFAWRVMELANQETEIGLFLPAMTLFDQRATEFRQKFFKDVLLRSVANFSNLAEVLSAGRFRVPSAAFFYTKPDTDANNDHSQVKVFSPLVANQEVTRPSDQGERIESWCIVLNEAEICEIDYAEIIDGSGLPWKIASWGSHNDVKLLRRLERKFSSLGSFQDDGILKIDQGPDLSDTELAHGEYATEYFTELKGVQSLDVKKLAKLRHFFTFPPNARLINEKCYVSKRSGTGKLEVCRGPHVIVSAARNFAVYEEDYLVVPSRQIGIVSKTDDRDLLKALSLFLSSDFAFYHQLFTSTEFGVKRDRATLDALKQMPCPLFDLSRAELKRWVSLHEKLCKTTPRVVGKQSSTPSLFDQDDPLDALLAELNDLVSKSLGLSERDRALISDFVNIRFELNDGKVGRPAVRKPESSELKLYAKRLQQELDSYVGEDSEYRHAVSIISDDQTGMISVDFVKSSSSASITVSTADRDSSAVLATTRRELQHQVGQWLYFNRNLRIHEGTKTYLLKPMQRFHWTESQAMVDASEVIGETLAAQEVVE